RQTWSLLRVRRERPSQAVREHLADPDARYVADGHASLPVKVDDTVTAGSAGELARVLLRRPVDEHVERLAEEPAAPVGRHPTGHLEQPRVAARLDLVADLVLHLRRSTRLNSSHVSISYAVF